jgi:hypothetical protein
VQLRAEKPEQAPEGAQDSEQDLSGAPPDCPVALVVRSSNGRTQRLGDVAGAPDYVRWHTGLSGAPFDKQLPNGHFGGWGYKYPQPPTLQGIQVFSHHIQYKT